MEVRLEGCEYRLNDTFRVSDAKLCGAVIQEERIDEHVTRQRQFVSFFYPEWLDYNYRLLRSFVAFCRERDIEVLIVEGQTNPIVKSEKLETLADTVRSLFRRLPLTYDNVRIVWARDIHLFTSAEYHDYTHVSPEAARIFTRALASLLPAPPAALDGSCDLIFGDGWHGGGGCSGGGCAGGGRGFANRSFSYGKSFNRGGFYPGRFYCGRGYYYGGRFWARPYYGIGVGIPFGFGSDYVLLNQSLIQVSGLNILMSRGVGNLRNRREVIELVKAGGSRFIDKYLKGESRRLSSLEAGIQFVKEQHDPPKMLHEIPHAYLTPASV